MLIDSHCHLEKFHKRGLLPVVLEEAEVLGVGRMITVGTSVTDWELYRKLSEEYPGKVAYTVGLHPTSVEDDWEDQVALLPGLLYAEPEPNAMGEMGLDHFHLPKNDIEAVEQIKARQVLAFERQLQIAKDADVPIVIHCFADGADEMKILKDLGGWASFTGIITYKNGQNVRDAALVQGLDRLMLETDSPYLTPEPHRGKENRPGYTRHIAESCAELFGVTLEEIVEISTANVENFYGIHV
jgi:TatD DNase family protein